MQRLNSCAGFLLLLDFIVCLGASASPDADMVAGGIGVSNRGIALPLKALNPMGTLAEYAEYFSASYDADIELDAKLRSEMRDAKADGGMVKIPRLDEIDGWALTNTVQCALWKAIEEASVNLATQEIGRAFLEIRNAHLPKALETALRLETSFCQITNKWSLESLRLWIAMRPEFDAASHPIKMRYLRKLLEIGPRWNEGMTENEASTCYMMEETHGTMIHVMLQDESIYSNKVTVLRIACAAGIFSAEAKRCEAASDEYRRMGEFDRRKKETTLHDIGCLSLRDRYNSIREMLVLGIYQNTYNALFGDNESVIRKYVARVATLAVLDKTMAKEILDYSLFRTDATPGRPYEYEEKRRAKCLADAKKQIVMLEAAEKKRKVKPTFEFVPCVPTPELRKELDRYGLTAGYFDYMTVESTNRIGYLLHTPKGKGLSGKKVPLVAYIPGSGEVGPDLTKQFHHRRIFELVTSEEFQRKRPCYFLAISPPDADRLIFGRMPDGGPNDLEASIGEAIRGIARTRTSPAVDENRIYLTGFSFGGTAVYGLTSSMPELFAASVPVAAPAFATNIVPETAPCNIYHLYNEGDYRKWGDDPALLVTFGERVRELGGDFRVGTYPVDGHNAWDAAWNEEAVWDWMFSKSRGVRPTSTSARPARRPISATCTASRPARDERSGPERACDGLDGTAYVSAEPMGKGDWFQAEFSEPVTGRVSVRTGEAGKSKDRIPGLAKGIVETSSDGRTWTRSGRFGKDSAGECSFMLRTRARFIRILPESSPPGPLAVREIGVER